MLTYEVRFLLSLAFTICTETLLLWFMVRAIFKQDRKSMNLHMIIFAGFIASFATLPYVWFVMPAFIGNYVAYAIASELFAFAAESVLYAFILRVSVRRAVILSLACNAVSFLAGEAVKAIASRF